MGGHEAFSPPARLAAPDEGITVDELRMAARNHGMPLEMLAHDVTPVGLHYLLVHYDIPSLDHAAWRLEIGGHVERPLVLDLDELRDTRRRRTGSRWSAPATGGPRSLPGR